MLIPHEIDSQRWIYLEASEVEVAGSLISTGPLTD